MGTTAHVRRCPLEKRHPPPVLFFTTNKSLWDTLEICTHTRAEKAGVKARAWIQVVHETACDLRETSCKKEAALYRQSVPNNHPRKRSPVRFAGTSSKSSKVPLHCTRGTEADQRCSRRTSETHPSSGGCQR